MNWRLVFISTAVMNHWNSGTALVPLTESSNLSFIANIFPFSEIIRRFPTCMVHIMELTNGLDYLDSIKAPFVLHRAGDATGRATSGQRMRAFSSSFKTRNITCILIFNIFAGLENAASNVDQKRFLILHNNLIRSPNGHLFNNGIRSRGSLWDDRTERSLPEYVFIFDVDFSSELAVSRREAIISRFISKTLYTALT